MSIFEKKFSRSDVNIIGARTEGQHPKIVYFIKLQEKANGKIHDRKCTRADFRSACDSLGIPWQMMMDADKIVKGDI